MGQMDDSSRLARSTVLDILTIAAHEELIWKAKWLVEGDEITTFYHRLVAANKRRNYIAELLSTLGDSLLNDDDI